MNDIQIKIMNNIQIKIMNDIKTGYHIGGLNERSSEKHHSPKNMGS